MGTTFHEGATAVLGMSADDMRRLESQNLDELEDKLRQLYYSIPLHLTVRAKGEAHPGKPHLWHALSNEEGCCNTTAAICLRARQGSDSQDASCHLQTSQELRLLLHGKLSPC